DVDVPRKRISLSMKTNPDAAPSAGKPISAESGEKRKPSKPSSKPARNTGTLPKSAKSSSTSNPFAGLSDMMKK
ncbi:MAG TPA: hypothetical protein PKK43_11780, partial [Spirochaetota bacterium]|nr:hypothetical protein [Spirochaetota bacterium]